MKNAVVKVDLEFSKLLPTMAMGEAELESYKSRLVGEPNFAQLVVWKEQNILLDGHLKLSLCKKSAIPYEVRHVSLPNRQAAKAWIVQNQLQRRNLSAWQRIQLVIDCLAKDFEKLAKTNQRQSKGRGKRKSESDKVVKFDVNQMLADKASVSRDTMVKARNVLRKATKEELAKINNAEASIEKMYQQMKDRSSDAVKKSKHVQRLSFHNDLSKGIENSVQCMDVLEGIKLLEDGSLDLMVTSPPFNCKKKYKGYEDNMPWQEYLAWLKDIFAALKSKFRPGGRCVIEIEEIMTREEEDKAIERQRPTEAILKLMLKELGYEYNATVIWDKIRPVPRKPLGSYRSPSSPIMNNMHSYILVFSVGGYKLTAPTSESSEMSKEDWDTLTQSIWRVEREHHPYGSHPCQMPVQLAVNIVRLWSHKGGLVADIFAGSSTVAIACIRNGRKYVMIEKEQTYCAESKQRIEDELSKSGKSKKSAA